MDLTTALVGTAMVREVGTRRSLTGLRRIIIFLKFLRLFRGHLFEIPLTTYSGGTFGEDHNRPVMHYRRVFLIGVGCDGPATVVEDYGHAVASYVPTVLRVAARHPHY
jgi:hypothetical protein